MSAENSTDALEQPKEAGVAKRPHIDDVAEGIDSSVDIKKPKVEENVAENCHNGLSSDNIEPTVASGENTNVRDDAEANRIANPRLRMNFLPKYCGKKDIEKVLKQNGVTDSCTIKKAPKWDYCYIAFKEVAARDKAVELLTGKTMKEKPFEVKPFELENVTEFIQKRSTKFGNDNFNSNGSESSEPLDPYKKLSSQVTPLADQDYVEEQLIAKRNRLRKSVVKFGKELLKYLPKQYANRHHEWPEFTDDEIRESLSLSPEERAIKQLSWLGKALKDNGGAPCDVESTTPSPIVDGYRNKCEFSFGISPDGKKTVGFMLGLFREGIVSVLEPSQCKNVSDAAKNIVKEMQSYLDTTDLDVYDRVLGKGFWRLLMARTLSSGENMVMVQVKPLPEDEKEKQEKVIEELKTLFSKPELQVTTFLVQYFDGVSNGVSESAPIDTIFGNGYVTERLLGLDFRIGPVSFFQVNTPAAEILYNKVREWCDFEAVEKERKEMGYRRVDTMTIYNHNKDKSETISEQTLKENDEPDVEVKEETKKMVEEKVEDKSEDSSEQKPKNKRIVGNEKDTSEPGTVVLDLCCGTGTIGLTMAGHVKKVIGVDIVESAVIDAIHNAKLNNIPARLLSNKKKDSNEHENKETAEDRATIVQTSNDSVVYIADKAENAIKRILREQVGPRDDVVAVLDPPRTGCHSDVIKAIRDCSGVDRVIFVSCDSEKATQNFVDLCRPTSNKFKGLPFVPRLAAPVDLFPHTKLCELVLSFRRICGRAL